MLTKLFLPRVAGLRARLLASFLVCLAPSVPAFEYRALRGTRPDSVDTAPCPHEKLSLRKAGTQRQTVANLAEWTVEGLGATLAVGLALVGGYAGLATMRARRGRHALTALKESEERFAKAFRANPAPVSIATVREGRLLDVNARYLEFFGYARDEVIDRTVPDLQMWADPADRQSLVERLLGQRSLRDYEARLRRKDGRVRDVLMSVELIDYPGEREPVLIAIFNDITERKQFEAVLRQSREQFQRVFEASPLATTLNSLADGRFVDVNDRFLELGEFKREDVIGRTAREINLWCDPALRDRFVERASREKVVRDFDARLRNLNGREYDVLLSAQVIELATGPVLMVQANDITARRQAEAALREREARLRAIITAEPECVKVIAPGGELLEMNDAGLAMLEVSSLVEARARPLLEWIAPEYRDAFLRLHHRVMSGETGGLEFEITGARGTRRWLETRAVPLRDAGGNISALLGVTRDVTEHRQHNEELRLSEARARALLDYAPEAIVVLDLGTGRFVDFNPQALTLFGYAPEELRQLGPANVSPPVQPDGIASAEKAVRYLREAAEGGAPTFEWMHCHRDGRERPCEVRLVRLPARDRVLIRGSMTEISERKRAQETQARLEDQLRQLQKMESIGQLAGGVAHDFNNLLTVIQGNVSLMLGDGSVSAEAGGYLREVAQAAERAASLTRQLLAFSRRQVMQSRRVNLNEVVADLLKMLGRLLGETVAIRFDAAADLPPVLADVGMLEQVLVNLAVNARDAMPQGGDLHIATSVVELDASAVEGDVEAQAGRSVCLSVSDTGCGIPAEHLPRIFEPFFTTKDVGKGTGLGLATVFGIVKQHGGWIHVTSEVGQGTTVKIYLPAAEPGASSSEPSVPEVVPRQGRETILVVEDEEALRTLMRRILEHRGYRVILASSGAAALELWPKHQHEVDLLLTDLVMPHGVGGRELATQLIGRRPNLKVVYTTGYSADAVADKEFFREGVNFVQKPFLPSKLLETVRNCLDG